jgi:hypothetical protein
MPSAEHEAFTALFTHRPGLVVHLLTGLLGLTVPPHDQVRVDSAKATDLIPTEYIADAVVVLTTAERPVMAVVVEVQRRLPTRRNGSPGRSIWPLWARLDCPVALLVVSPTAAVARWCAQPIHMGHPGWVLTPLVVGPDLVPVVTDPERARNDPELTVLSAMTHARQPEHYPVLQALLAALTVVDHELFRLYYDLVFAALPAAARHLLEEQMTTTYEYRSEFMRNVAGKAMAEGEARAVLTVLEARGVDVPERGTLPHSRLHRRRPARYLGARAVTATTDEDLFDEG